MSSKNSLQFSEITDDLHYELTKYLSSNEMSKVSRISKIIWDTFHHESWKNILVINNRFQPELLFRNKKVIYFDIFLRPQLYSWFPSRSVSRIDYIWDFYNEICHFAKFVPSIKKFYSSLDIFNFKIGGDFSKLAHWTKFSAYLTRILSEFRSVSLEFLFEFGLGRSRQKSMVFNNNFSRVLNLNCFGAQLKELYLGVKGKYSINILNLNHDSLRNLFISTKNMTLEYHRKLFCLLSRFNQLDFLSLFIHFDDMIPELVLLPHHIKNCEIIISVTNKFIRSFSDRSQSEPTSLISIPQVTALKIASKHKILDTRIRFSKSIWQTFEFPNLKKFYLTRWIRSGPHFYSFTYIPHNILHCLTTLYIDLIKFSDSHSFLFNLKSLQSLQHLSIGSTWLTDVTNRKSTLNTDIEESARKLMRRLLSQLSGKSPSRKVKGIFSKGLPPERVFTKENIKNNWIHLKFEIVSDLISDSFINPTSTALDILSFLAKAGYDRKIDSQLPVAELLRLIPSHLVPDAVDLDFENIENNDLSAFFFWHFKSMRNYKYTWQNFLKNVSMDEVIKRFTLGSQNYKSLIEFFGSSRTITTAKDYYILKYIVQCAMLPQTFMESVFLEVLSLKKLKTFTIRNCINTLETPRLYILFQKHESLSSIFVNCSGNHLGLSENHFYPYVLKKNVCLVKEFPKQNTLLNPTYFAEYTIDVEGRRKNHSQQLRADMSTYEILHPSTQTEIFKSKNRRPVNPSSSTEVHYYLSEQVEKDDPYDPARHEVDFEIDFSKDEFVKTIHNDEQNSTNIQIDSSINPIPFPSIETANEELISQLKDNSASKLCRKNYQFQTILMNNPDCLQACYYSDSDVFTIHHQNS